MERARKQRLVYVIWGVVCLLALLGALPTFLAERWPPPLAQDQVLLVVRRAQSDLLQFDTHREGLVATHPWTGNLIAGPESGGSVAGVWQYSGSEQAELAQLSPTDWSPQRSIQLGQPFDPPVFTPDGRQLQANLAELDPQISWIDPASGSRRDHVAPCRPDMITLLPPIRSDEALLLCLWELWVVTPTSERPLLTAAMGVDSTDCTRYVGRPFGIATDLKRKRLWVTGEGGLLCQIDPSTGAVRHVATLPIRESERVNRTHLQYAPATDLLYIGVHQWDTYRLERLLVWDLKQNRLRAELALTEPLMDFRLTSDGAHLIGVTEIRPGEFESRLIVIEAATGKTVRTLGQFKGAVLEWAVLAK